MTATLPSSTLPCVTSSAHDGRTCSSALLPASRVRKFAYCSSVATLVPMYITVSLFSLTFHVPLRPLAALYSPPRCGRGPSERGRHGIFARGRSCAPWVVSLRSVRREGYVAGSPEQGTREANFREAWCPCSGGRPRRLGLVPAFSAGAGAGRS